MKTLKDSVSRFHFIEFLAATIMLFPLICFAVLNVFQGRPASDDYCAIDRNLGGNIASTIWRQYIHGTGRPSMNLATSVLEDLNTYESSFLATRLTGFLIIGVLVVFIFRLNKLYENLFPSLLLVAATVTGVSISGNLFITTTFLPSVLAHTLPTIFLIILLLVINRTDLSPFWWTLSCLAICLWLETAAIGVLLIAVFYLGRRKGVKDRILFVLPSAFSIFILLGSPGNWNKLHQYNSPLQVPGSLASLITSGFHGISEIPFAFIHSPVYAISLILIGTLIGLKKTQINWLQLFTLSTLISLSTAFFLGVTSIPTYAKFDFLGPASLALLALGIGCGSSINNKLEHYNFFVLTASLIISFQLISYLSIAIGEISQRQHNWDLATTTIETARSKNLESVMYPKFTSPISEPGNYIPARNCASGYFGINLG